MSVESHATVRVPGSTSNLGAGFDCIGFAVDRWLTATVVVGKDTSSRSRAITIDRRGTLAGLDVPSTDDMLFAGFVAACTLAGHTVPEQLTFTVTSEIPIARGLGSSSAALVAGALLADRSLGLDLGRAAIAELCTQIEGHPDNVGPAVFGGCTMGVPNDTGTDAGRWVFANIGIHPELAFVFVVPPILVNTAAARAILPKTVDFPVAVRATGKSAALAHGLTTGDAALLRLAFDDVLHVPYRRALITGMDTVVHAARVAGAYGATISGSGSTLLAVTSQGAATAVADAMRDCWTSLGIATESFIQRRPARAAE